MPSTASRLRATVVVTAVVVTAMSLSACVPATSVPAPAPMGATTLLVRLGSDTIAMEQYTRSATRMDGMLVTRAPFAAISRYSVMLDAGGAPARAEYSLRRGDGAFVPGAMQSLSLHYRADSVTLLGHRAAGDTMRANVARGMILPFINNSYGLFELAIARLMASGRDSAEFTIVPMNFGVRNTNPLPLKLLAGDSLRATWFGSPLYGRHDARGGLLALDGRQTTVKVRVDRVAATDLEALAARWHTAGATGQMSTRDTVNAMIGDAQLWIDYGRPALRGRDVWVNGVLGDSIWRTGANAATQLRTSRDLLIGGQTVPAGTYSLWTRATDSGYQLIINRQAGQWGTEYHPDRDLLRVPLRESNGANSAERFTIGLAPQDARSSVLAMTWGTKVLSVPVSVK